MDWKMILINSDIIREIMMLLMVIFVIAMFLWIVNSKLKENNIFKRNPNPFPKICEKCGQNQLSKALEHPLWKNHKIENTYSMDGKGQWKIAYYPLFECGKTGEIYQEPRALIEQKAIWNNVDGIDFREVPLRYLKLNKPIS